MFRIKFLNIIIVFRYKYNNKILTIMNLINKYNKISDEGIKEIG